MQIWLYTATGPSKVGLVPWDSTLWSFNWTGPSKVGLVPWDYWRRHSTVNSVRTRTDPSGDELDLVKCLSQLWYAVIAGRRASATGHNIGITCGRRYDHSLHRSLTVMMPSGRTRVSTWFSFRPASSPRSPSDSSLSGHIGAQPSGVARFNLIRPRSKSLRQGRWAQGFL